MSGKPVRTRRSKKGGAGRKPYDKEDERAAPLGSSSALDRLAHVEEAEKDDEERQLESLLFGKKPKTTTSYKSAGRGNQAPNEDELVQASMGHVADGDVSTTSVTHTHTRTHRPSWRPSADAKLSPFPRSLPCSCSLWTRPRRE
jgi:hypothetical protein